MKKYESPELDIIKLKAEEVLTDSNGFNLEDEEDNGDWLDN
jgi:hypothetical protein